MVRLNTKLVAMLVYRNFHHFIAGVSYMVLFVEVVGIFFLGGRKMFVSVCNVMLKLFMNTIYHFEFIKKCTETRLLCRTLLLVFYYSPTQSCMML